MKENSKNITRRDFIGKTGSLAAGLTILPSTVISGFGYRAPSDKLNIAIVGIGGMGKSNLKNVAHTENIVALCDVDWGYSKKVFEANPKAKAYWDWRKMYDEMGKSIDAVMVATADHTHAIISAHAITMGKHVYLQKPLTHSVYESRLLTRLAAKYKVATQLGNQGSSDEGVSQTIEWLQAGEIGDEGKGEAFNEGPIWPRGWNTPEVEWGRETLNWDLFVGPAKMRPYNSLYTPWNWRGWWDFGTGALGDMACHILQPAVKALNLKSPIAVQGSSTALMTDCAPNAQIAKFIFPARDNMPKVGMPRVEVTWYDGGLLPEYPKGWPAGRNMNDSGGAVIFYGTKDTLVCGCYGVNPWLLSGREIPAPTMTREVPEGNHILDFVRACKEGPDNRIKCASDFSEAGPLNEMVVMGVLAVRLQGLNRELQWDGEAMKFTNISPNDTIRMKTKDGFSIKDGHPTFNHQYTDPINALEFANELIRHTYRSGYSLPEMP